MALAIFKNYLFIYLIFFIWCAWCTAGTGLRSRRRVAVWVCDVELGSVTQRDLTPLPPRLAL